jgi:hypothetical protein
VALVLVVLLAALVVGRLAGGTAGAARPGAPRSRRLAVLALAVQVLGAVVGGPAYPVGLAVSAWLAVTFLVRNRDLRGTGLLGLGLLANALVVVANGAMPVSEQAAARAGADVSAVVAGEDPRHELTGPGTRLALLADVVPVPLPGAPQVVSPGDVLVAAGVAQLVVAGMLRAQALSPLPGPGGPSVSSAEPATASRARRRARDRQDARS